MEWITLPGITPYESGLKAMEDRLQAVIDNRLGEAIYLLEHDHVYTAGTGYNKSELIDPGDVPVIYTGRGGKFTYHGPGQRVIYPIIDLRKSSRERDLKLYIRLIEDWIISTLEALGLHAYRIDGLVGIWTSAAPLAPHAKIAAIGIRMRKWVGYHGIAVNISNDLSMYDGIVACGISEFPTTSLKELGYDISLAEFDQILKSEFERIRPFSGS